MGNILVIKNKSVNFSDVAVERVKFLNDAPVIKISESKIVTIIPFEYAVATYYTTNGSVPDSSSRAYKAPFAVSGENTVKAVSVYPDGHYTKISTKAATPAWHEVDLSQFPKTGKAISNELLISDVADNFESYIIPVIGGSLMRITACTWSNANDSKYSPCAFYFNSKKILSSSIIAKVNITPTTIVSEKTAACYNKVEFEIPNNVPYLFIQGRMQGNTSFVDGYDLKLEEYR